MEKAVKEVIKLAKLEISDIDLLIPHQANIRIVDHVSKKLGLSKEKVYVNLQKYGNTSAASIPITLDETVRAGLVKPNDLILTMSFVFSKKTNKVNPPIVFLRNLGCREPKYRWIFFRRP